jgi:hypothetical protein
VSAEAAGVSRRRHMSCGGGTPGRVHRMAERIARPGCSICLAFVQWMWHGMPQGSGDRSNACRERAFWGAPRVSARHPTVPSRLSSERT